MFFARLLLGSQSYKIEPMSSPSDTPIVSKFLRTFFMILTATRRPVIHHQTTGSLLGIFAMLLGVLGLFTL